MTRLERCSTFTVASLCAVLLACPARAQEGGPTEADRLFQHAVGLMKEDRCSDAIPELLQSQALDPSAGTLLNLGTCYARLERKATAYKTYRRAAEQAAKDKDEPLRERALQAMTILEPTLTKLQIVSPADSPQLSVRVNGEVVSDYTGLPIPLDPGENVIEAAAPGHEPWRQNITAPNAASTLVVHVPELRPLETPPPALPPSTPEPDHRPDLRIPAAAIGGAGLAAIIVGTVFGVSAKSTYDDSAPYCNGNDCTPAGITLRDNARDKAAIATVTVTSGLIATAAGVVMWLVSGKGEPTPSQRATAVTAWSVPGGGGIGVELQR